MNTIKPENLAPDLDLVTVAAICKKVWNEEYMRAANEDREQRQEAFMEALSRLKD